VLPAGEIDGLNDRVAFGGWGYEEKGRSLVRGAGFEVVGFFGVSWFWFFDGFWVIDRFGVFGFLMVFRLLMVFGVLDMGVRL
jgi:hypothetical protein